MMMIPFCSTAKRQCHFHKQIGNWLYRTGGDTCTLAVSSMGEYPLKRAAACSARMVEGCILLNSEKSATSEQGIEEAS
jgi:hypothetical protein